jgi:carbonic anhydrase
MPVRQETLGANARYAHRFNLGHLSMPPAKHLAIVTCMDARLTIEPMLGLTTGDAHIIRNAGGIITEDELRSLIISHKLLGTDTFFVINHTDCGMLTFSDEELQRRLKEETSIDASGIPFYSFRSLEDNVRAQVRKIRQSPFIAKDAAVHGFIYDVKTGRLNEVKD